jgi:hypothetical protein
MDSTCLEHGPVVDSVINGIEPNVLLEKSLAVRGI